MSGLALLVGFILLDLAIAYFVIKARRTDPPALRTYMTFVTGAESSEDSNNHPPTELSALFGTVTTALANSGWLVTLQNMPRALSALVALKKNRLRISLGFPPGHFCCLLTVDTPRRFAPKDSSQTRYLLASVHSAITLTQGVDEPRWHKRETFASGRSIGVSLPFDGCRLRNDE
jgi:hypothetical protein